MTSADSQYRSGRDRYRNQRHYAELRRDQAVAVRRFTLSQRWNISEEDAEVFLDSEFEFMLMGHSKVAQVKSEALLRWAHKNNPYRDRRVPGSALNAAVQQGYDESAQDMIAHRMMDMLFLS